jgi:hypothetical protein
VTTTETPQRSPHTLVVVKFLAPAKPFGRGDHVELTWRDAEGLVARGLAAIVPLASEIEHR